MPAIVTFPSLTSYKGGFPTLKFKKRFSADATEGGKHQKASPPPSIISNCPSTVSLPSYRSRSSSWTSKCPSYISEMRESEIINAVAFDGGGVRGASSAKVIAIIMDDLAKATGQEEHVHEHFDILAGTSTGGLIAIMLGRLKVPIDVLLDTYSELSSQLFRSRFKLLRSIFKGSKYSGDVAEKSFQKIVRHHSGEAASSLRDDGEDACNVFVTTVNTADTTGAPLLLRSYDRQQSHTVAESAQATTAAPTYFPPKELSSGEVVVDGGVRFNNPAELLIQEARREYGHDVKFGVLLSVGTGEKGPIVMKHPKSVISLMALPKTMGAMMTDSEAVHQRVDDRFEETGLGLYVRINVPGIGDIMLNDCKSIPAMLVATEAYMNTPDMLDARRKSLTPC